MVKEGVPARYRLGVRSTTPDEPEGEPEEVPDDVVEAAIRERSEAADRSE